MDTKGHSFLDRVFDILKDETADELPLIQFKHPKELEEILSNDLDISINVDDKELENSVRKILQYSVKTNKVTFRNQLYGPMDPYGLAGTWIAEAFNTSQYTFEVAPVFTLIELKMIEHILKLFGIPGGDGIFSPGGSISMLYALVAARFKTFPEVKSKGMKKLPEMVIFTSEDMIVDELNKAIEFQLSLGKYPVFVNATAGTTVLGAIDDLEAVASICKKYNIWMHVDMIGAPLQCSIFLLKEKGLLHEANAAAAQYLFQQDKFYDVRYDTGDKSVQCGRKIDSFKLWMMWKARGDIGLCKLMDHVMSISEFCLRSIAEREGFRLVSDTLQCPNICFWYIPVFMRKQEENDAWWALIHKITPKLKELLTLSSRLMIAYTPLRHHKNFFRLAFTFHPVVEEKHVLEILQSIEECGEMINIDMV
ncbi:unnamed protein product [Danaus chrysippus]|uniref:(African queen) hypothetical protein n=1 Tax=Danaus chrysippus TaxID=151541 RepID=A0A8J2QSR6_9NEOP|nr:unnamed protein product [Danaus chrysippus]